MKLTFYRVEVEINGKWKLDWETESLKQAKAQKWALKSDFGKELPVRVLRVTILHHSKVIA